MSYREKPMVDAIERRFHFEQIEWLDKSTFEEKLNNPHTCDTIYPYIVKPNQEKAYIGKFIAKSGVNNIAQDNSSTSSTTSHIQTDTIGQVEKDSNGLWKLYACYSSNVYEFAFDFLVLNISNHDAYYWFETEYDQIPKYALKAAVNVQTSEFMYIGKTKAQDSTNKSSNDTSGFYYLNGYNTFNYPVPEVVGKIILTDKALHVPIQNQDVQFSKYQILCLKPSPSTLKNLCRIEIRKLTSCSNIKIKKLNDQLPSILINYLKYPSSLAVGEYMLKGEKLISEDDKFELYIDVDNYLVCENKHNNKILLLNNNNIDSIWLQRTQTVFFYTYSLKLLFACIFNNDDLNSFLLYKFKIITNNNHPKFIFEEIVHNRNKKHEIDQQQHQQQITTGNSKILYNYFSHYDETYSKYFAND